MKKKNIVLVKKNQPVRGFESMGFAWPVYKGIMTKGYKIPTPIQRKVIPLIMNGKDILAMSRTGSGKTAAFLLPLLQKLYAQKMDYKQTFKKNNQEFTNKHHSTASAIRALIISPTRELALQTYKFLKDFARFSAINAALVLGGDSMDTQFALFHNNKDPPDIIIATPGRLLHLLIEMDLHLKSVNTLILDEADRLLEMGFSQQLAEIVGRLPGLEDRQTLLFSATVPTMLAEFSKSQGILNNDDSTFKFVRLDTDFKLSQTLNLHFLATHSQDKLYALLYLLQVGLPKVEDDTMDTTLGIFPENTLHRVEPSMTLGKTLVFLPTKHHVEYIKEILDSLGMRCTYAYSSLDPIARKANVAKFASGDTKLMLVTDIAARGIDIPLLDNVIMYAFPATPKLFLHRVGRVARAGKSGNAYAILAPNEVPYLHDLMNFLGHDLIYYRVGVGALQDGPEIDGGARVKEYDSSGNRPRHLLATLPRDFVDDEKSKLEPNKEDFFSLSQVCERAFGKYLASLPAPSKDSIKKSKSEYLALGGPNSLKPHPMFESNDGRDKGLSLEDDNLQFLSRLRAYKPDNAIFEDRKKCVKLSSNNRNLTFLDTAHHLSTLPVGARESLEPIEQTTLSLPPHQPLNLSERKARERNLKKILRSPKPPPSAGKKMSFKEVCSSSKLPTFADPRYFIHYRPSNFETEKGLELPQDIVLDLADDEGDGRAAPTLTGMKKLRDTMVWDSKRKKFINPSGNLKTKTIRTESGVRIPASYKTDIYKTWLKKSHGGAVPLAPSPNRRNWRHKGTLNPTKKSGPDADMPYRNKANQPVAGIKGKKIKNFNRALGLKQPEQVFKERSRKERINTYSSYRRKVNSSSKKKKKRK